jgi:hypothetical protein
VDGGCPPSRDRRSLTHIGASAVGARASHGPVRQRLTLCDSRYSTESTDRTPRAREALRPGVGLCARARGGHAGARLGGYGVRQVSEKAEVYAQALAAATGLAAREVVLVYCKAALEVAFRNDTAVAW